MNKLPLIEKAGSQDMFRRARWSHHSIAVFALLILFLVFFVTALVRLFQITIVKGEYYYRLSDENRIREIVIEPRRGDILDRNGAIIATSEEPIEVKEKKRIASRRVYAAPEATAHLVGYRQTADAHDLDNDACLDKLVLGDKTGKKGVEKIAECTLRGTKGKKLIELDAHGNELETLTVMPPVDGRAVQLSTDLAVQKKAFELLKDQKGAIIASVPQTGEIIALASNPAFDPQVFEDGDNKSTQEYLTRDDHPLFNRSSEGTYPPGSLFKLIIATGALEDKTMDEETEIEDTGEIQAGPVTFGNWYYIQYGRKDEDVNIVQALRRSNDIYFYKTGEKMGVDAIRRWADRFGLGRPNGSDLEQAAGTIPSPYWKEDRLGEKWYLGDTYNLSIGQGYLLTTPLQMHLAAAAVTNGGALCAPQLFKDGKARCASLQISADTIAIIKKGMKAACETGGTAWPFFDFTAKGKRMAVGCKTGTAESHGPTHVAPHAWFTVFAPFDNPQIQITVLVENGGQGSDVASPLAKELLASYLGGK